MTTQQNTNAREWAERRRMVVEMPDGSEWSVPVMVIARSRAQEYKAEFDGDVERSLDEDTLPRFLEDDFNIRDWASNNMNWGDVQDRATILPNRRRAVDYQDGWVNGPCRFTTVPA